MPQERISVKNSKSTNSRKKIKAAFGKILDFRGQGWFNICDDFFLSTGQSLNSPRVFSDREVDVPEGKLFVFCEKTCV